MNTLRIKRRSSGTAGSPAGLINAELAYNEVDDILYYGKGISTGINAATVVAVGGLGMFINYASLTADQTFTGANSWYGEQSFYGVLNVPTANPSNSSTNAANTAWVRNYAQPVSAQLTALSTSTDVGGLYQISASTYAKRALTGAISRITVTNADGVAGNPSIDLATTGILPGAYTKATFDAYGRAVSVGDLAGLDVTNALGYTPERTSNKGVSGGYASLDFSGKVPINELPDSIIGGLSYQGVWNADTNVPALVSGTGTKGFYYKVSISGNSVIDTNNNWTLGDLIAFNGSVWDKIEGGSSDVVSVAGRVGIVTLTTADISGLGTLATQNADAVNITGGTIDTATLNGIIPVSKGGTGITGLSGYVTANGNVPMGAVVSIPNTDITGLGTLSTQNAGAVNITGGTIEGIILDGGTF